MSHAVVGARYMQLGGPTPRWTSLREWGIRPKLIIVLAIPTLAALSLGGVNLLAAVNATSAYGHVADLSSAAARVTTLVNALQAERDLTADRVARGLTTAPAIDRQQRLVDRAAADLRASVTAIDTSYDPVVRRDVTTALSALSGLPELRDGTALGAEAAISVVRAYTGIIGSLLRVNGSLWVGSEDAAFVQQVAALEAASRAGELASQQRALLNVALLAGAFPESVLSDLIAARAQQEAAVAAYLSRATQEQQQLYRRTLGWPEVDRAATILRKAVDSASTEGIGADAEQWYRLKSQEVDRINRVASNQLQQITSRVQELRAIEQRGAVTSALILMLILLFALAATVVVARSMIRPLQRLRSAAFEVADHGLPEVVRRLHEGEAQDFDENLHPVDVAARDEIGQVARAFDEVHAQAVRLAGEQALMRKNMSAMFVNLSRRSQSLVERQLRVIDELENSEQDPDQLASLFTLDLLATRMRRNDENLLVLAGAEGGRRWSTPVALLDVVRAAVAEVEQYSRVRTDVAPGFEIATTAVGGVVHLLAELLENAASFSAPGTPVEIRARGLGASGEVMVEIEDQGIGMTESQMAQANERLAAPPIFDVSASRMMGLYVVARLAQRHNIRVRLRSSVHGGVIALVQLPDRLVLPVAAAAAPGEVRHSPREPAVVPANGSGPKDPLSADAGTLIRSATRAHDAGSESLPIFDTIQSEWFSRPPADERPAPSPGTSPAPAQEPLSAPSPARAQEPLPAPRRAWSSPADEGWRVAHAVSTPVAGGVTGAGLPIRVRGSNLVPGTAGGSKAITSRRPAPAARGLSSFQRGVARGRTSRDAVSSAALDYPGSESAVSDPAETQQEARP